MNVLIKVSSLGSDAGSVFQIIPDIGLSSPESATRENLLSGMIISVDDSCRKITITSDSSICAISFESIIQNINCDDAGGDTPTPTPTSSPSPTKKVSATPTPTVKSTTITCVKGKITTKVTGINPKCPSGYTKKG